MSRENAGNNHHNDDETIPSRPEMSLNGADMAPTAIPVVLERFFQGDIDIDAEYVQRFPTMPMLSVLRLRDINARYAVATLSKQDGAASLIVDIDRVTGALQFTFIYGSMLAQRFQLAGLTGLDRRRWLEAMRADLDKPAFLWSEARWQQDYVLACPHEYCVNVYAFSPLGAIAAARVAPAAMSQLLDWLDQAWRTRPQTLW